MGASVFDSNKNITFYRNMLEIRLFEEEVAKRYPSGKMKTPTHLGIGQEAIAVGVLSDKSSEDVVFSHHRCHNHFLAAGGQMSALAAELYGKATGCSGGRGGSVHLVDSQVGFLGSSAILGQSIALGVGAAFGKKSLGLEGLSIVFFGDGALEEGIAWESINFAAVHKLPVLFVCENNFYSTESNLSNRRAENTSFCSKAESFGVESLRVDGNDVIEVARSSETIMSEIRKGGGPRFIEAETYRWMEHVGPFFDHEMGREYRTLHELELWKLRCPIQNHETKLLDSFGFTQDDLEEIRTKITTKVASAFQFAEDSLFPDPRTLGEKVYSQ
jgi:pyruvate dehydrogenase E1 component alpha subunit